MPTEVIIARTAPPAITPVPSGAGFSKTCPDPKRPRTWCGIDVSVMFTRTRCFFADSMPLRIACGTSLAFPERNPTTPADASPTTTSAANDMFLPPLTTLVTRLIETTSSLRLRRCASSFFFISAIFCITFWLPSGRHEKLKLETLELQTCFAGCIGEGFDAAVIEVAAAVEDHLLDALLLRALGDELADGLRSGDVSAVVLIFGLLAERRGRD